MATFKSNDDSRFNDWLQGMSDEARADVLKVKVTQAEESRRALAAELTKTQTDDSWQQQRSIRALFAGVAFIALLAAGGLVGNGWVESTRSVQMERIRVEHPSPCPPTPAPLECRAVALPRDSATPAGR